MSALLLIVALASHAAAACDVLVHGQVVDGETGESIADAAVSVGPDGRLVRTVSDATGHFEAPGQCEGFVRVSVSHPAYHRTNTAVEATEPAVVQLFVHDDYEIVVTEEAPLGLQDTRASVTLEEEQLDRQRGDDLAGMIENIPGVTRLAGTGPTSKPVVRGQFAQRLALLVDRVPHHGQKWGLDHAPEIDAFAADRITVVRGAAGVRYGADAVGGVILVDPEPMREQPGTQGSVHAFGASNGLRAGLAARVDTMPAQVEGLSLRLSANATSSADRSAPDYILGNTASRELNIGMAVGYAGENLHARISWDRYDLSNGICYCAGHATPASLLASAGGTPVGASNWERGRGIDQPRQQVTHDRVIGRFGLDVGAAGHIDGTVAFQHNHRVEEDAVRDSFEGEQLDFTLRTTTADVAYSHPPIALGLDNTVEGSIGVAGLFQENVFRGVPLVPNHRTGSVGVYAWERLWRRHAAIEVGGRVDRTFRSAFLTDTAKERLDRRGIDPDCEPTASASRCDAGWTAAVATIGGMWGTADDRFDVKLDLSSGARAPSIDEQFLNGSAPTFPVLGLGDPRLGIETAYTVGLTSHVHLDWVHGEVAPYASRIDDYIQFVPVVNDDGSPVIDVLARGAFPRYAFVATDATFVGVDAQFTVAPDKLVSLDLRGSMVRAQDTSGTPLGFIPSDRAGASLVAHGPDRAAVEAPYVAFDVDAVRRQDRTPPGELAPPPDGYVLLGVRAGTNVRVASGIVRLSGELRNLTNARTRDYLSLFRYYADLPGRDAIVRASWHFDL